MRWNTPPTPGALARVRVVLSRSVITYSAPSAPLAGTSRFHRMAAYTRCLRCAGAPRRPASGSELSLHIPSWHAVLSDPGELDIVSSRQRRRHRPSPSVDRLGTPDNPANPFRAGVAFRGFSGSHIATACQVACPPCTDLT